MSLISVNAFDHEFKAWESYGNTDTTICFSGIVDTDLGTTYDYNVELVIYNDSSLTLQDTTHSDYFTKGSTYSTCILWGTEGGNPEPLNMDLKYVRAFIYDSVDNILLTTQTFPLTTNFYNVPIFLTNTNELKIQCLYNETLNIANVNLDYPSATSINATIETGCQSFAVQQIPDANINNIYLNGLNPNTIIDETTSNLYFSGEEIGVSTINLYIGETIEEIKPLYWSVARIVNFIGTGNQNIDATIDLSGGTIISDFISGLTNFNSTLIYNEELTPDFNVQPYYYNYVYNDEVLTIEYDVTMIDPHTMTWVSNLIKEGVGIIDSQNNTGIIPNTLIQHSFTLLDKGIYYVEVIGTNEDYPYEHNFEIYGTNSNRIYFNTTPFAYGELYYVPILQFNSIELPINNDTTSKFNALAQGFIGNNETLKNLSFYFANTGITPLYDININLYQGVYNESSLTYDCQFISNYTEATSLSQGFIDKNLINDTNAVLVTSEMTPYLLEQDMVYCLVFNSNSQDIINPNDVVMFYEDTDPYNELGGEFFKTNYVQFSSASLGDLAGFIYSSVEEIAILGCTNPLATNYNVLATQDDGSCILPEEDTRGILQKTMEDTGNGFAGFFDALFPSVSSWLIVLTILVMVFMIVGVIAEVIKGKLKK